MEFKKFRYTTLEQLQQDAAQMEHDLPFCGDTGLLAEPVVLNGITLPNSLATHPMEGVDGNADGSPSELTGRRYRRISSGGAGVIWFEAVAVTRKGRAYPRQLWINRDNVKEFKNLLDKMRNNARNTSGQEQLPIVIMQLTHSGRFSKPDGRPEPVIAVSNPYLDKLYNTGDSCKIITDEELEQLEEQFADAAGLAAEAGFDGVDVKACHRYLISELLSSHTREGRYGGGFEGRTSFLLNTMDRIRSRVGRGFIVTSRINVYDGIPWPYGWGVDRNDFRKTDLTEPVKLAGIMHDRGTKVLNTTMGTPYYNPHVNRPYDSGPYVPDEHPLEGIARLARGAAAIQQAVPGMAVAGTGYTWLRHFSPYLAAGLKRKRHITIAGYGRQTFAYPDFAKDIIQAGGLKKEKCCIACGKCTELMRAGGKAGCVIRDSEVYGTLYRKFVKKD